MAKRVAKIIRRERTHPLEWYYVSFADAKTFFGVAIIQAHGVGDAAIRCHALGINPGGNVLAAQIPKPNLEEVPPETHRNRLLSLSELREIWPEVKTLREWEEERP